uniref:Tetratricopeptide repeat protein 30 n=1 Tax=Oryzias sinensis TaxID=183150 RepID=A0A8C7XUB8_9TELE
VLTEVTLGSASSSAQSRAALSLLGFCYYHLQDFPAAAECYEQLTQLHPEVEEYKLYYAQSLYKAGAYAEATKASFALDNPASHLKLQACIKYCEEDHAAAKVPKSKAADEDLKNYPQALKYIAEIIERGIKEHPELSVGVSTEGADVHSVGNTLLLHQSALIEAFNLKAAIEFQLKNLKGAQEALTDMPPRSEEELDPVTLHNQALMNMDPRPSEGFEKLSFLVQQPAFPPVCFGNLLLLYCKHEYFDLAADVLAENAHLTYKLLSPVSFPLWTARSSFDALVSSQVQDARLSRDEEAQKKALQEYDLMVERYIVVLMGQAKIYWNHENFQMVEKLFRASLDACKDCDTWKLNVAHVLFMQNKYKEAIGFYEPIVKKHYDNILSVSAVVLANLCVSYIMTNQNEEAEELMRKIEKEEEQISYDDPDKKVFHLCIVNLVIGTLYCAKGNYDFGISRVIKSLEPYSKKLGTDTWFYAKRCFLSLLENMSKDMVQLRDAMVQECVQFLEHCETYGKEVPALIEQPLEENPVHLGKNTVTYEARVLKALFYAVTGWTK